jgi:hypothetical protein
MLRTKLRAEEMWSGFLHYRVLRSALGPIQLPIQWIMRDQSLCGGGIRSDLQLIIRLHPVERLRISGNILALPPTLLWFAKRQVYLLL